MLLYKTWRSNFLIFLRSSKTRFDKSKEKKKLKSSSFDIFVFFPYSYQRHISWHIVMYPHVLPTSKRSQFRQLKRFRKLSRDFTLCNITKNSRLFFVLHNVQFSKRIPRRIRRIQSEQFVLYSTQPLNPPEVKPLPFPRIVTLATTSVLELKPSFMTGW